MAIEIFVGGRRNGKTTRLIEWVMNDTEDEPRAIVCTNFYTRDALIRQYPAVPKWKFVVARTINRLPGRGNNLRLGVDDADLLLAELLGHHFPIGAIVLTDPDVVVTRTETTTAGDQ